MNLRTTLVLLVLVAALFLVVRFRHSTDERPIGPETLLGDFAVETATKLDLNLATGEMATLERRGKEWWISDPFADRADQDGMLSRLFGVLISNPRERTEAHPEAKVLAALKLEPPRARVTIASPQGSLRIRIGARDPTDQFVWVQFEGDPALYRTGANLSNVVESPRQEWRDPRFIAGDAAMLRSVTLTRPGEAAITLVHDGADWRLTSPVDFVADATSAQKLASGALLLTVKQFVAVDVDAKTITAKSLDDRAATLALDWGPRKVSIRFGLAQTDATDAPRYAIDSERNHLFLVEGPALEALRFPAKRFRDPVVLRVKTNLVERIRVQRPGRGSPVLIEYRPATQHFEFVEPFTRPVDDSRSSALTRWLNDVSALVATDFKDEPGKPGDRGFLDRTEMPQEEGVDPMQLLGFDQPDAILEFRMRTDAGTAKDVVVEFAKPAGDGTVPVLRADKAPDTVYLVSEEQARKVLAMDPRQFLQHQWFPADLNHVVKATFTIGDRAPLTIERSGPAGAQYWQNDPKNAFQAYLAKLSNPDVVEFTHVLPRDVDLAADGLAPPAATVHCELRDESRPTLTLLLGKKDPTGAFVLATCDAFPERTTLEVPAWILDDLLALAQ